MSLHALDIFFGQSVRQQEIYDHRLYIIFVVKGHKFNGVDVVWGVSERLFIDLDAYGILKFPDII